MTLLNLEPPLHYASIWLGFKQYQEEKSTLWSFFLEMDNDDKSLLLEELQQHPNVDQDIPWRMMRYLDKKD